MSGELSSMHPSLPESVAKTLPSGTLFSKHLTQSTHQGKATHVQTAKIVAIATLAATLVASSDQRPSDAAEVANTDWVPLESKPSIKVGAPSIGSNGSTSFIQQMV